MMTLFGMILAIGIVVDDAIVVIENTERNMTQFGLSPKEAAKRAMTEVTGPVVAIVLVLNAVFIPGGVPGGDDRRALQAICHHDCHFRGVLGVSRAHPLSGAGRHPAQTQPW